MFSTLPITAKEFMQWPWEQIEPFFQDLQNRPLQAATVVGWLSDWTRLEARINEAYQRLYVAITVDTSDALAQQRYADFLDQIYPRAQAAGQKLKEMLIESKLEIDGFEIPLRNMRTEAEIFRQANLGLLAEELKLSAEYDRIVGAQSVNWEEQEVTLVQLEVVYQDVKRERREEAWRLGMGRWLEDRERISRLWRQFVDLRRQIAANAGEADYRAYRWKQLLRFDYTPQDCADFQAAIEEVAVPAALRLYEKRRRALAVDTLRPWDLQVDLNGLPALRPFQTVAELERGVGEILDRVDPQLGSYFEVMRREGLLDLDNRKGKAPGGYCTEFAVAQRPFVLMNATGIHDDVQTLLHEGGHAFHIFESSHLPYVQQQQVGMEFGEVASMGMELLASAYLDDEQAGFYTPQEAARARIEFLDGSIRFWPYMAVVDGFQHWVYENPVAAGEAANCDAEWCELWERFMVGVDWSGLQEEMATGWQRKLHIHQVPFYYIEYGLAQLGAFQVWRNARSDQAEALAAYRRALSLGGSVVLPELYLTAGAKFAFDADTLRQAVDLGEETIEELEAIVRSG
jgi:oligoendopeptidase F